MKTALLLLTCLVPACCAGSAETDIDRAFGRLYNFDFAGAQRIIDGHLTNNVEDPLGYAVRASGLLFSELDRLMILESEFFADDKRIIARKKLQPDMNLRARFFTAVDHAQRRAHARLGASEADKDALFTLCLAGGLITDYASLVEKKQLASFSMARQAHRYAVRLKTLDPQYYDAYLSTGITEYILGSVPFFIRWFLRFDDARGDKELAIRDLELVARSGRYLKPFAKILLAIVHLREKRPAISRDLLADLAVNYPENPLIRKELHKVNELLVRQGR